MGSKRNGFEMQEEEEEEETGKVIIATCPAEPQVKTLFLPVLLITCIGFSLFLCPPLGFLFPLPRSLSLSPFIILCSSSHILFTSPSFLLSGNLSLPPPAKTGR